MNAMLRPRPVVTGSVVMPIVARSPARRSSRPRDVRRMVAFESGSGVDWEEARRFFVDWFGLSMRGIAVEDQQDCVSESMHRFVRFVQREPEIRNWAAVCTVIGRRVRANYFNARAGAPAVPVDGGELDTESIATAQAREAADIMARVTFLVDGILARHAMQHPDVEPAMAALHAAREYDRLPWDKVAELFPPLTAVALRQRWHRFREDVLMPAVASDPVLRVYFAYLERERPSEDEES